MTKAKKKNKALPGYAYHTRRRRISICKSVTAIGRKMREEISVHVKTCKQCQARAHENMTNNMIEMAIFACD